MVDTSSVIITRDRFGFAVAEDDRKLSKAELRQRAAKDEERTKKWLDMIRIGLSVSSLSTTIKRRVRKGIPDAVRAYAWYHLSGANKLKKTKYIETESLDLGRVDERTADEIERDIDRTFPKHVHFSERDGSGQAALRRLLHVYAVVDPEVGYCQGMGFIAGLLLTYLPEDQATLCFIVALKEPKYNLRELYLPSLTGAKCMIYVFGELGRKHLGALWRHLIDEGVDPSMYATEWLMTMFCRGFSFDLTTRVWEIFVNEGIKIVYRVALALLKSIERDLLDAGFEDILALLKRLSKLADAPHVLELGWKIPVRRAHILKLEKQHANDINCE